MLPRPIPGFDAPGAPPMRPPPGFDNAPPPGGRAPPGFDNAPPPTMRPPPGFDNAPPPPQPKSMPGFDNLPRFSTPQQPPSHALPNPGGGYAHHAPPPPAGGGGGGIGWDAPPSSSAGGPPPPPRSSFDRPAPPLMAPPHMGGGGGGGYQGGHHHGGGGGVGAPGGYGGPSPYGGGPSGYGGGGPPRPPPRSFQARDPTNTVWVGSVDPSMSEEFIATRFAPYGRVLRVSRHVDKGMAFVHFRTVEEAAAAVENLPSTGALPPQMKLSFGKMFQYDNDGNELRGGGGGDGGGPSGGGPPRGHFEGRRAEYHERRDDDRPRSYDDDYSRRGGPREDYNRPPPPPRDDYRDRPRDDFDRPRDDYRDRPRDDYYRDRPRDDRPRDDYRPRDDRGPPRDFDRRDRRDEPTNVLWVGDLVPEVTDDDLQRNFGAYGSIKKISRVQHRNFGFVHFHSVDECSRALHMLRGTQFNGRTLTLRYGNADSDRSGPGGAGGGGGGFDRPFRDRFEEPTNIVYVGQLPPSASELELRSLFQPYEGFVEIRYSAEKACAFGHFETLDQAKTCKDALQGQSFHGVPLRVSYGKPTGHHGGHVGPAFGPAGGASKGELTIPGMGGPSGGGMSGALALVAPVSGQASLPTEFGAGGPAPVGSTDARDNAASAPAPAFVTRPRVTPRVTLDRKVAAVIAGSYFGGSVVGPHIGQAQVIDLCNAIDNISSNEDAAIEVKPMLFAAARVNSLHHAVAIVAKRLKEYHNDDPHKKLLGFYCVALVMHQQSPPSKSALDAFVTLASVVSSGLEEAAMSHFRSVLDSLRTYLDGNVSTSDAETLAYFDQIISSCKTQGALASLLKKVKGTA